MARKLKAALAKYQAEQKLKQKKTSAEKHSEKIKQDQKAAKAARTRAAQARASSNLNPWLPFEDSPDDTVLTIGEGDFSFTLEFIEKFPNVNIIASSLDTQDEVIEKYGEKAQSVLASLQDLQTPVLHQVDATQLATSRPLLANPVFQSRNKNNLTVAFNFPHLGNSVSDQDRNVRQHQQLILAFFQQCKALGASKVVISMFVGEPYESWQPKQLARSAGYQLVRSGRFPWDFFGEYEHQLTSKGGAKTSKAQRHRDARIYLWELKTSS